MNRAPRVLTALLFVVIGVWCGLAIRTEVLYVHSLSFQRYLAMSQLIQEESARSQSLHLELMRLKAVKPFVVRHQAVAGVERALAAARALAGEVPVRGEGLRIVLSDAPVPTGAPGGDQYLIHDVDLVQLVNALFAAGARAVSVNGQRIVATSAIHCVGPVISVNGVRSAPPVVVLAQGPAGRMAKALAAPGGIVSVLRLYGLPVHVTPALVTVPAYRGRAGARGS